MKISLRIEQKLQSKFLPEYLEVINESHKHNVPHDSETHFRLVIVSVKFEGMSRVRRHQQIYDLLKEELQDSVHALALKTCTPKEWNVSQQDQGKSPQCLGGGQK